jgi:hypothetical protein
MLSLFANKVNRISKGKWDPNKFKIDAPYYREDIPVDFDNNTEMVIENVVDNPLDEVLRSPQTYRALDHITPELSQFIQPSRQTRENFRQVIKPLETSNLAVNPIENLESAYAVKTGPTAPQQLKEEWSNKYCDDAIPSKYLTQNTIASYELMGLNEAQRRSRPMGEGVPNIGPAVPLDQINGFNFGRGQTSFATVNHDLYHGNFATLGGPPAVYTGIYNDPLTGIQYDTFESALPPPDGDWYDISYASAKNRKLDSLQGGWSNNTPIPPRKEILEGDWNQAYDRTINTYGGTGSYDEFMRCRQMSGFERSVRFNLNEFTPDNEAPELTGVPANVDGIYGNVKVRWMPRAAGTNRGHDEETSFRTAPYTANYHNNKLAQDFTKMPQCLPPLEYVGPVNGYQGVYGDQSRSEYNPSNEMRGLEATAEYASHGAGFVDTYGEQGRSDYDIPNRMTGLFVNSELGEHGIGYVDTYAEQSRSDYNPPTKLWGMTVTDELGEHGVALVDAFAGSQRLEHDTPTKQMGLEVNSQLAQHGVSDGGAYAVQSRLEHNTPNKIMGQNVNQELSEHGVYYVNGTGQQSRSEYEMQHKFTGMDVNPELGEHGVALVDTFAEQSRSEYEMQHKFTGMEVNDELIQHGVALVDTYAEQSRSDHYDPNKRTGTTVSAQLMQHGVGGGAYGGQNRKALTRTSRLALLKSMQGAFKSATDGQMNRMYPTRFNTRKNTTNTVLVPSKMMNGIGGPQNVERVPNNWAHYRTPSGHRPSEEVIGAVSKAVYNDTPIVGQFPVREEIDEWRMGPASNPIGNGNDIISGMSIRAQGPCATY